LELEIQHRLRVCPAIAADLPAILNLERQCPTAAHWSERQYEELFRGIEGGCERFVLIADASAEASERGSASESRSSLTLGFLIANRVGPEWELENLVVSPDFRRKRLATGLFAALLTHARETDSESIFLEVRESNQAARALYARLGFEESGRRKLYYANPPEDAVLYRLKLI
jgi:ribosomal protein S18 acetylase RimI-like enzyme